MRCAVSVLGVGRRTVGRLNGISGVQSSGLVPRALLTLSTCVAPGTCVAPRTLVTLSTLLALSILLVTGCGGASSNRPRPGAGAGQGEPTALAWDGDIASLVPEDAYLLAVTRPTEVWSSPALAAIADAALPEESLAALRYRIGTDIRELDSLVVLESDRGTSLIATGPMDAAGRARSMAQDMVPLESQSETPFVRRVGHYRGTRCDVAAIAPNTLVITRGTPMFAGAILQGVRARSRSASEPEDASGTSGLNVRGHERPPEGGSSDEGISTIASMLDDYRSSPVVVIAPRPLELPTSTGVGMLLARETSMLVALYPGPQNAAGDTQVRIVVEFHGEFPPHAADNFRQLVGSLSETDFGAALGMRDIVATLQIAEQTDKIVLRARISAPNLTSGLQILVSGEIAELISAD